MKEYVKTSDCPAELAKLIEIANLTPANIFLPYSEGLEEIYRKRRATRGDKFCAPMTWGDTDIPLTDYEIWSRYVNNRDELIRDLIIPYPKLVQYLDNPENYSEFEKNSEFVFAFTYLRFVRVSMRLREIAKENLRYVTEEKIVDPGLIGMYWDVKFENRVTGVKYFIENGKGQFRHDEVQEALKGVNPIRVRICPICKNIFWAKKNNSATCGNQKCVDDLQNIKKKARKQQRIK
jgi:hypothetical protein